MIWLSLVLVLVLVGLLLAGYVLLASGRLTIDTGWGRRTRVLGPQIVRIAAPREMVFDLVAVPYLSAKPPREIRDKVEVLERTGDMVLAAHRTKAGPFITLTVETVAFHRPDGVEFRLVRGPVPLVTETFALHETGAGTELEYSGVMGTDGWVLGAAWGRVVARHWERAVAGSLDVLKSRAEDLGTRRTGEP
jgi:hypothetical protein